MADASFFSPYAVGGATRPDSFTNLNPLMRSRLMEMLMAAREELGPDALKITSAYRSPELQAQLYQNALQKYGSPEVARKWVAPAGRSQHNFGTAVDFANPQGQLLRDPNSPEAKWLKANATRFGLAVPLSNEPWQVELEGARSGNVGQGQQVRLSTKDAAMAPTMTPTAKQEEPQSLWDRLTGRSEATGLNPLEAFAAGLDALILPEMRMGDVIRQQGAQRAKTARTEKQANQTIKYLTGIGRDDLAKAVGTGAIDPASAIKVAITGATEKDTALIRQALAAGLKQGTPEFQQYILSGGDIYSQETALLANLPKPPDGMRYQFDKNESGKITNYKLVPIEGGPAAAEAAAIEAASQARKTAEAESGMVVLEDINKALDIAKKNPYISTGFLGGLLKNVGGTPAKDLTSLTTTIKANIGFDRLQRMRDESPTGGALGQVAVQELEALQSTLGNLDNSQTNEQFVGNMERLEAQYRKTMSRLYNAALQDQAMGIINKVTKQVVSPTDYFSQKDIDLLSGKPVSAGTAREDKAGAPQQPDFSKMSDDELRAWIAANDG